MMLFLKETVPIWEYILPLMPSKESRRKKHEKKKTHIKQLNLALHNSLNVYSLKCVCACTHIHVECTSSTEYFMLILEKKNLATY